MNTYTDVSFANVLKDTREKTRTPYESLFEAIFKENGKSYEKLVNEAKEQPLHILSTRKKGTEKWHPQFSGTKSEVKQEWQDTKHDWEGHEHKIHPHVDEPKSPINENAVSSFVHQRMTEALYGKDASAAEKAKKTGDMKSYHKHMIDHHNHWAKAMDDELDEPEESKFHKDRVAHHTNELKKLSSGKMNEAFEVYSLGANGQRANIPTTDSAGKSKYSDAASAAMQKIKLEKESPGKHWTIVTVQDEKGKDFRKTAKQQGTETRKAEMNESEVLTESADHSKSKADDAMKRASKLPEGTSLKNAAMASHHGNMNTYHEKMTDHHIAEAYKAETAGDKVTAKLHIDQVIHHQDQAKDHRQKRSSLLAKITSAHRR